MTTNFVKALAAAAAIALPMSADALSIEIDAGGTTASTSGMGGASFIDSNLNGWNLNISASAFSNGGSEQLSSNAISAVGVGTLTVTTTETFTFGNDGDVLTLAGLASVSNAASSITVEHFVDVDGSGFVQAGADLVFASVTGSAATAGYGVVDGSFDLQTVITIVTDAADTTANVNADIVASVPVPAAGLMLLAGLGGLGAMRRRKS